MIEANSASASSLPENSNQAGPEDTTASVQADRPVPLEESRWSDQFLESGSRPARLFF
ncbi:hypothetical protein [Vulcanococcus sp.]|uniref:hypothetical protein n=1 Tax=Vulcanococcus sp. TaxID=2856995 RepID=UPI003C0317F8